MQFGHSGIYLFSNFTLSGCISPFAVFLRQTNCQSIKTALLVQKRREISIRRLALKKRKKEGARIQKASVQHPYRGYRAKQIAEQRRSDALAATAAATRLYEDPRLASETTELRQELRDRTGKGTFQSLCF